MKKLALILTTAFFLIGFTVEAQMGQMYNKQSLQQQSMMQQGMMGDGMCPMCGQMMQQHMPMKKYVMMVNKLPSMQEQLALSDDQVNQMIDLQTAFKKQQIDHQAALTKKQMKMQKLLDGNAPAAEVKKQMQQCAETKIDMKVAAYETVGKMKALLTAEQKENLQNMCMKQNNMMQDDDKGMMQQGNMMKSKKNQ